MNQIGLFFNEEHSKRLFIFAPKIRLMVSIFDDMTQVTEAEVQRMLPLVDEQRRDEALRYRFLFGQFACLKSWLMLKELLKTSLFYHVITDSEIVLKMICNTIVNQTVTKYLS